MDAEANPSGEAMRIRNAQTTRLGWICIVDIIEQSRPADLRNVTRNVWF
jgi:hypothetical protein